MKGSITGKRKNVGVIR